MGVHDGAGPFPRQRAIKRLLPKSKRNVTKEYPGLNHLFQHCATGLMNEYRQIEETIAPEVLSDIAGVDKWAVIVSFGQKSYKYFQI